ncbi:hypothetical protein KO488_08080 [Poseidonibacter lekithochrous]|uniref:DUF5718 family protein n=1 Tax=Poseidonibacter TaxID=2321187 RepID=UPI001C07F0BD|nr:MULTISPECIES: DUF5718 family protein [Poseidonibacter]MBU3014711.1 hypothetical protein [Poseidonibacter lekithochrous]MDO6828009.1 DUF5718 family protein [Poseidonibacter sp. 1_MG-2023]
MLIEELKNYLGFAVAGNFAGHLGEAGEADEFKVIKTEEKDAPKGLFPFYIKEHDSFLSTYPISHKEIYTHNREEDKIQAEPELSLICDFVYENKRVIDIVPKYFSAFNDCSLRVQDGKKLSTKKNWGIKTKGISKDFIKIDNFTEDGILNKYHLSSFIKRDGKLHNYGTISAVKSYSYFFTQLKDWMIEKFNTQEDCGPLEELGQFMKKAEEAKGMLIASGATAYSEFGKRNFLKKGDELFIYVYNARRYSHLDIINNIGSSDNLDECSRLHQIVK